MVERVTLAQARRIALAAQGLHRGSAAGAVRRPPGLRQLTATAQRLGVIQIDSVNVLARAHLMPLYSRLGPYDINMFDRMNSQHPRRLVETWAHEASLVPVETWPLLAFRRQRSRDHWVHIAGAGGNDNAVIEAVLELLKERGPLTASQVQKELSHQLPAHRTALGDGWGWRWSSAKGALEILFYEGEVTSAGRNPQFERIYDLTNRVLPPEILSNTPQIPDAIKTLVEISAKAHGIATERDLFDYFRLKNKYARAYVKPAIAALVEEGVLTPTEVTGLPPGSRPEQWYLHRDAVLPRRAARQTLLSPFDPLVFERTRLQTLFGVDYRIEIYTPKEKRQYGYYVLPFLDGERISARVDLKADRAHKTLLVQAAHAEPFIPDTEYAAIAERLLIELQQLAAWLGLEQIEIKPQGSLAGALQRSSAAVVSRWE